MTLNLPPCADSVTPLALGPWHGRIEKPIEKALSTGFLDDPEAHARAGRVLRQNNYRVTSRVVIRGLGATLVKAHHPRGTAERLLSLVRAGRARREYETGRHLCAQGIPVPRPYAYGERRSLGMRAGEFYIGAFHDDVKTVGQALEEDQPRAMQAALLRRAALLVRGLHDRGFDHRDLHAGNVLVHPGPGDRRGFVVVDLHRSRMGVVVSRRARARALAQWVRSIDRWVGPGGRSRIIQTYLGETQDKKGARAFHRRVERWRRRLARRARRSRGKRCFKNSTQFTRDVGRGTGARARVLSQARLDEVLTAHDAALELGDARVAKLGRKRRVTTHGDVVVKESVSAGFLTRLKDTIAPGRHRAGYAYAHRLAVARVDTAQALAYLRRDGRSFSIFADVSDAPRLDLVARERFAGQDRAAQKHLIRTSAEWMAELHRRGIYHSDLKGVNVRLDERGPAPRFVLIDTDRCRIFDHPVDERRRVKNLAQLAASIPISVTRSERLRWFRIYARGTGLDERRVAHAVAAQLAQKNVVVDAPLE